MIQFAMKTKKLLLTLLALLCFVQIQADVEINETNFPDENFRNFLKFEMFRNSDVITDAQIACFFIMDVEGKNISNLKGIEYFTALTTLNCPNNQLTSLDISKNTGVDHIVV